MELIIDFLQLAAIIVASIGTVVIAVPLGILIGLGTLWLILSGFLLLVETCGIDTSIAREKLKNFMRF